MLLTHSRLPTEFLIHVNARLAVFSSSLYPIPNSVSLRKPGINHGTVSCTSQHGPANSAALSSKEQTEPQEDDYRVVAAITTSYNDIVIVDTGEYRALLLDSTGNVHSIVNNGANKWTNSYWDEFASLPAIIPDGGKVAMLGLGGGTAAHLMLETWPRLDLEGWEIDGILIDKARDYLGLSALERPHGHLEVKIGDALLPLAEASGKYSGIVVDLFGGGKVVPALEEEETWAELKGRLMPGGRIMANCGGIDMNRLSWAPAWELNAAIKAMSAVFGHEEVSWKNTEKLNYMALTGPFPDLDQWARLVPGRLINNVRQWRLVGS